MLVSRLDASDWPRRSVHGRSDRLSLGVGRFDLAHQLVGFVLGHLTTAHHVLEQIARALEHEVGQSSGGTNYVFHRRGHLASRFEADLVSLGRHLGDGIFDVSAAMTWAALGGNYWSAGYGGRGRGRYGSCRRRDGWLFFISHLWAPVSGKGWS